MPDSLGNVAGRQAIGTGADQKPNDLQAVLLRQRTEARQGLILIHDSIILEI